MLGGKMLNIGCHLSISKGYENMGKETLEIEANTFQFLQEILEEEK